MKHSIRKKDSDLTLNTLHQGFELAGFIGKLSAVNYCSISVIGVSAVTICSTIASFGTLLQQVVLWLLCCYWFRSCSHLGLFSSGPSTEEIMKRMGKLIEKLADHLDKRFTVIEGMISQVTKQIAADFSQLENELGAFYKDTMKNFTLLAKLLFAYGFS